MAARQIPRRIVVFLGAGASVPFGYPLTSGFLPRIWDGLHTPSGSGSWRRWSGITGRRDANQLAELLAALLPGLSDGAKLDGGASIVDVISLVDQIAAEARSPHINISLRKLLHGRQLLNKAINGVLRGGRKLKYARRLADWIIRASTEQAGSRVSIISTNYDTAVEHALFKRFVQQGASVGRTVDLGMPWRDSYKNRMHVRPVGARLALLKLHGSLNWLRCEQCGHVSVSVTQRIASLDHWETRSPRGYNVCWCNGLLRSILVTPSVVRDVRDANLLGIWGAALEDLRLADEWVFVGYSLPTEDIAIRSVLLRAWHSRRRQGLRVRVVQCERPNECALTDQEKKELHRSLKTSPKRGASKQPKVSEPPAPSESYKRYRLFFPQSALREIDYKRTGVEEFVDGLEVLSEAKLEVRMRRFFGGFSRRYRLRREKLRVMIFNERKLARKSRR